MDASLHTVLAQFSGLRSCLCSNMFYMYMAEHAVSSFVFSCWLSTCLLGAEASDRVDANANLQCYRQEAAAEDEAAALHANTSSQQKHDSRWCPYVT